MEKYDLFPPNLHNFVSIDHRIPSVHLGTEAQAHKIRNQALGKKKFLSFSIGGSRKAKKFRGHTRKYRENGCLARNSTKGIGGTLRIY